MRIFTRCFHYGYNSPPNEAVAVLCTAMVLGIYAYHGHTASGPRRVCVFLAVRTPGKPECRTDGRRHGNYPRRLPT